MTSAGPARKPYRKAPPQHRESRHSVPVFRDDLAVSAGTPGLAPPPPLSAGGSQPSDPCQVICLRNHTVPVLQRTRFTNPYPVKCPPSPEGANVFSSSWSLASDSELDVSSLSSLDVTVLPPPRIFSHGSVGVRLPPRPRIIGGGGGGGGRGVRAPSLSRFLSRSEDLLALSPEDEPATSESSAQCVHGGSPSPLPSPARSPERSLVFKETAEIFAPLPPRGGGGGGGGGGKRSHLREPHLHPLPLPPKGILKQPAPPPGLPPAADGLRKAKSVEMLGQPRAGRGAAGGHHHHYKPKSTSLDREQGGLNQGKSSPLSQPSSTPSASPADFKMHVFEEKVKFSHFLDEITYRVLSPANLHLLGQKKPEPPPPPAHPGPKGSRQNPKQSQSQGGSGSEKERKGEKRPWDDWVAQHQATRREREREKEKENQPQARPKTLHGALRKESPDREPEKWRPDPDREGARPKSEGAVYGRLGGGGGGGDSRRTSESDWEERSRRGAHSQHHLKPHHHHHHHHQQHQHQHPHPHQHAQHQHQHHTPSPYQQSPQQHHTQQQQHHPSQYHAVSPPDSGRKPSREAVEKSPPLPPKLSSPSSSHSDAASKASPTPQSSPLSFLSQLKVCEEPTRPPPLPRPLSDPTATPV